MNEIIKISFGSDPCRYKFERKEKLCPILLPFLKRKDENTLHKLFFLLNGSF